MERSWLDELHVYEVPLSEAMVLCRYLLVPSLGVTVQCHSMAEWNVLVTMEDSANALLTETEETHGKTLIDLN